MLYRIDLPNDAEATELVKLVLGSLASRFSTGVVDVDVTCCNAARIFKAYGTTARKGDSTTDRPHRLSRILFCPAEVQIVSAALLRTMTSAMPSPDKRSAKRPQRSRHAEFDVQLWLDQHGIRYHPPVPHENGRKFVLEHCPFDSDHQGKDAAVFERPDGYGFKCFHNSCAGRDWRELRDLFEPVRPAGQRSPTPEARPEAGSSSTREELARQRICTNGHQLHEVSSPSLCALQALNDPPELFARMGAMVEIVRNEDGRMVIREVSVDSLRGRLTRAADFYRVAKDGNESDCFPPLDVARDVLALCPEQWRFPAVEAVTEIPVVRSDGSILEEPGYDKMTRLYYSPDREFRLPALAESPTADHIDMAVALIDQLIGEFPFLDAASRANAIAALITPIIKSAIDSPAPLGLFDAPQAGTGKSLLCELVSIIGTGQPARMSASPRDPDEWRKAITASLLDGSAVIVYDNLARTLDSPDLCRVLTATVWSDRQLGTHRELCLPVRASFFGTGNNLRLGGDMPRRCYRIRLDAKMSRPHTRVGFKIDNLKDWTKQHRGELLAALLTIIRAWYVAGRPKPAIKPLGSFEAWTITVGGILQHAGVAGFLGNLELMYVESDEDSQSLENFLSALRTVYSDNLFSVAEIADLLKARKTHHLLSPDDPLNLDASRQVVVNSLPGPLAEAMDRDGFFRRRLGKFFSSVVDRRFGDSNIHISRGPILHGNQQWLVRLGQ